MVISDPFEQIKPSWWSGEKQKLTWAQYRVGESTIYIGNRPDIGTTNEFYKSVDGWINVSDRIVKHPVGTLNTWLPWNEAGTPSIETIYAVLTTLNYWVDELKLKNIYLHCDGGTHRAVSLFGFYLLAYHKDRAIEISQARLLVGRQEDHWSDPLSYARTKIESRKIKALPVILDKIKEGTRSGQTFGVSLETFLSDNVSERELRDYYFDRLINLDFRLAVQKLFFSFRYVLIQNLFVRPVSLFKIWAHKKLNTKKGQFYKKHNF